MKRSPLLILMPAAVVALGMIFAISPLFAQHIRQNTQGAMETSLVPNAEQDLTELTISDDSDHPVTLSTLPFSPLILMVRADGNFHEGNDAPVQANDLWRDSGQIWALSVGGAASWHFARQTGAGTVHIWIKALGSY